MVSAANVNISNNKLKQRRATTR